MAGGRAPNPHEGGDGEIEIRQLFELEDFDPGESIDKARELEKNSQAKDEGAAETWRVVD